MRTAIPLVLGVGAVGWALATGACDEPRSHIFIGRQYDPVHVCVSPTEAVDVVSGAMPSGPACPPICIIDQNNDVFVSGMCPPYPQPDTLETLDAGPQVQPDGGVDPCPKAFATYACNITCVDGGPNIVPDAGCGAPVPEAGGGAETGTHGSSDAGLDGASE